MGGAANADADGFGERSADGFVRGGEQGEVRGVAHKAKGEARRNKRARAEGMAGEGIFLPRGLGFEVGANVGAVEGDSKAANDFADLIGFVGGR